MAAPSKACRIVAGLPPLATPLCDTLSQRGLLSFSSNALPVATSFGFDRTKAGGFCGRTYPQLPCGLGSLGKTQKKTWRMT
jgi:hypothetical protein